MEGEPILKKTLVTVAAMVGAWVAFVGTVSVIAVLVTSHAVAAPESNGKDDAVTDPSGPAGGRIAPSRPLNNGARPAGATATHQAI